jgi:pSer/pThr/pTyr-binding forkhead associated (FHA) protein
MISIINRINNNHLDKKIINKDEENYKKIIRAERKKSTIAEFQQIKIPTNKKDTANLNQKNNINSVLYTNSNNTKNTGVNTYSNSSHIKKDLFSANEKNLHNLNYTNLDLEVINSWNLPKGLKIQINKDHLQNSLRNINDGKIYFGFQKDLNKSDNKPYIDYLLLPKDNDYDDKFIGIHFQIKYDENNYKYYIKDLGSGYGTFVKLIEPIQIKNNLLINIGETFIVFTFNEEKEKSDDIILKIFTGNEQREVFEFNPKKKNIIIGRDITSDVYIEDKMLSRKHCYIYYEKNENNNEEGSNWFIKDGDLSGKKSTNDTWIYALEDTLIYDQMIFKTNHSLFKCNCS